jgi:hypothetical protein
MALNSFLILVISYNYKYIFSKLGNIKEQKDFKVDPKE